MLGSARWAVHFEARRRLKAGEDIIELTLGEPDVPTPPALIDVASSAMRAGRTGYSGGAGEPGMLEAVAEKYAKRSGREVTSKNVIAMPGTQAALALCMLSLVEAGDDVLVPDPYYATYEGVVRATGAGFVPIPMEASNGFHLTAEQVRAAVTPTSKVLLLNSPHNPTGAVLSRSELEAIGDVCREHDLWILSDEVYENLIYTGSFASPFDIAALADRVIVTSSISKSHAAPGFRSGWCVASTLFIERAQGVAEAVLFGGQPFIADMTEHALRFPDDTALTMGETYQRRITLLREGLSGSTNLKMLVPSAGMFALIDIENTGLTGEEFAMKLLEYGVGVMPGSSFGDQAEYFVRVSLTVPDEQLIEAGRRIVKFAESAL